LARLFPPIPEGPALEDLGSEFPQLVVRAAQQLVMTDRPEFNPLFVWSPGGDAARVLLQAAGRSRQKNKDGSRVAMISFADLAREFRESLDSGVAGAWRERWWSVDLLLVHGSQDLTGKAPAQEEFSHLLEALRRRGGRIMVVADRPPAQLPGIEDRLEDRLTQGLVLELELAAEDLPPGILESEPQEQEEEQGAGPPTVDEAVSAVDREWIRSFGAREPDEPGLRTTTGSTQEPKSAELGADGVEEPVGEGWETGWKPSLEEAIWVWPRIDDRLVEAVD
jgi:chromosomal replication initiation ATPase DnaA